MTSILKGIDKMNDKKNKLIINVLNYKKPYAFIDIETYGDIESALPYDISIYIVDNDKIIKKFCILYRKCFTSKEYQNKCYYKDKLPLYLYQQGLIENKDIEFTYHIEQKTMCEKVNEIIDTYNISLIIGYNISFDYRAINRLYDIVNDEVRSIKANYKLFGISYKDIPKTISNKFKKVNYFDLWYGITELFKQNQMLYLQYVIFCLENDFMTESYKNISTNEDTMYKFFEDFLHSEYHIGFKDIEDEIKLFKRFKHRLRLVFNKQHILRLNSKVSVREFCKSGLYNLVHIKQVLIDNDMYKDFEDKFIEFESLQD